jgi:hypothetical protein
VDEQTELVVTNTATDNDIPPRNVSYQIVPPLFSAIIDANGIIHWTPGEARGPGTYILTTVATDDDPSPKSATNSFQITVNEVNRPPQLPKPQPDRTIAGTASLLVTNTAIDPDIPANPLTYVLTSAPTNAAIDANGIITWTPNVAQVPGVYTFTTVVTDTNPAAVNARSLSDTNSFTVTVQAIHNGPSLPGQVDQFMDELTQLVVTNTATDTDIPPRNIGYQLLPLGLGATIDTNGVIRWTPSEAQGPGTYLLMTIATDDDPSPKSATNSFNVYVNEVNTAPTLPQQNDVTISALSTLLVTNTATDSDLPPNNLTYVLTSAPTNAVIDTNGIIMWSPTADHSFSTNLFATLVTDDGSPPMSASNSFFVVVSALPATAPLIQAIGVSSNIVSITWSTVRGHTYRLQFNDPANMTDWTAIEPDLLATGTSLSATNDATAAQRIYRVQVVQ